MSEPVTLTLRPSGPENREEFMDTLKAFFLVRGYEAMTVQLPPPLYKRWSDTMATEKDSDGDFKVAGVLVQEGATFVVS